MHLPRGVNTFCRPAAVESTGLRDAMATELPGRASRQIILVVDDDCDQRSAFGEMLTFAGYEVVIACDGQEALELLRGGLRPTVIVLDLAMPRMSGWAFLERLRGAERSMIPVLVTSGDARARPPTGADACLDKPVDAGTLRTVVRRLSSSASALVPRG